VEQAVKTAVARPVPAPAGESVTAVFALTLAPDRIGGRDNKCTSYVFLTSYVHRDFLLPL
jgi:hypothetical protein